MVQWSSGPTDPFRPLDDREDGMDLDDLDRALLLALLQRPRVGLREHARALGAGLSD